MHKPADPVAAVRVPRWQMQEEQEVTRVDRECVSGRQDLTQSDHELTVNDAERTEHMDMQHERARIIAQARKTRRDIQQIFTDCASWNDNSTARKNGAAPIDCDPDGDLRRLLDGLDHMLAGEAP